MPNQKRKVVFGRINRRQEAQLDLGIRSFRDDLVALAESRETRAVVRDREEREWIAADLELDASGDFMMGVLGFSQPERLTQFDEESFSWLKGPVQTPEGASERTMVPFAIDLREHHQWVAFAVSYRIRAARFAKALSATLTTAVANTGGIPVEWAVDLVTDRTEVEEWLNLHPDVFSFERTVRFPNPVRNIDADREEMRALSAKSKKEVFLAPSDQSLSVRDNPAFSSKLDGLEEGFLEIIIRARQAGATVTFSSRTRVDAAYIDDFADDLRRGMDGVLNALREYVIRKGQGGNA